MISCPAQFGHTVFQGCDSQGLKVPVGIDNPLRMAFARGTVGSHRPGAIEPTLAPFGPDPHVMPMPEITARLSTALADRYKIERELGAGALFRCFSLFSNSSCNFINILFKVLNQITNWLTLLGKPPSFKRNLGRFVGLKDLLL